MTKVRVFLGIFIALLVQLSMCSSSPFLDNIKVKYFMVRLGDESLEASFGKLSIDEPKTPGKSQWPIQLGLQLKKNGVPLPKPKNLGKNKIEFDNHTTLQLENPDGEENCVEVSWSSTTNHALEDCFKLSPHHWYGGSEKLDQRWPINKDLFEDQPYIAGSWNSHSITEPYWLNSDGFLIYVNPAVPLFIDQNNHKNDSLCLLAKHARPYLRQGGPTLRYTMCKFDNPRTAHEFAIKTFLGKPSGVPDSRMIEHPVWSTWAVYKTNINEDVVLQYAKEIKARGFNNSHIDIDDGWETCYGSQTIRKDKFPDMKKLTSDLKKMGFRTTLWVHPFIQDDCEVHKFAADNGYLVRNVDGNTTIEWWNGLAGHVDFTNPAAADWFEKRIRNLLTTSGVDSYKFDAGESEWAPQVPILIGPETEQPDIITHRYIEIAAKFGPMIEIRAGKHSQNFPVFVRMLNRDSAWGPQLRAFGTILPTLFQMTMNGYPFIIPDMVGGNAYNDDKVTKEMFLRYLQLNVFMPVIQFSVPPWDFDSETLELTKKYTTLHYEYANTIIELMKRTVETGEPLNTPIWWVDPTNPVTYEIDSEYMLGENILVAPVMEKGAISRDIYLPKGRWRDEAKVYKPIHSGPIWLRNYPAPLDTLPYFTRVSSSARRISQALHLLIGMFCILILFK